jgi:HPt (histidine-containing phosphotransfer) domain-containing protein
MMPKMDGIEAAKIIQGLGYTHPIVALTANAVVGQSEMFLKNGFSDFVAKPIDIRQLNAVLNKLIRDKQPPEVLEAARREDKKRSDSKPDVSYKKPIDPRLIAAFSHDAAKSIALLESILEKKSSLSKEDISDYATSVHGIKSALANISKPDLSAIAYDLEMSAKKDPPDINLTKTSVLINSMKMLMMELKAMNEAISIKPEDEDKPFLQKQLGIIKAACEECDEKKADNAISHLLMKTWSKPTDELIGKISDHAVHRKFDEIVNLIENGELRIEN